MKLLFILLAILALYVGVISEDALVMMCLGYPALGYLAVSMVNVNSARDERWAREADEERKYKELKEKYEIERREMEDFHMRRFNKQQEDDGIQYHEEPSYDYDKFLKSDFWARRKEEAFKEYGKVCECCGQRHNLHVHHTTYEDSRISDVYDLLVLCDKCHTRAHELTGRHPFSSREHTLALMK